MNYVIFLLIKYFYKDLHHVIKHDSYATFRNSDDLTIINGINSCIEFRIGFYYRVANYFKNKSNIFSSYYKRKYLKLSSNYCITFFTEKTVGYGLRIGHIGNIIVHSKTIIGNYVTISQGVTIGKIHSGRKAGTPILEDKIYIGPNAVIVGNIRIGTDVIISGNSFVNFDVPPNSVVIGNPGVIHLKEMPTKEIICSLED